MRTMRAFGAAGLVAGLAVVCAPERGRAQEAHVFEQAVETLVAAMKRAEPKVRCEVTPATPVELGWRVDGGDGSELVARRLVLWTPAGLSRAFGLIARAGAKKVELATEAQFDLVAVGPDLLVVTAPPEELAALTLDARNAAAQLLTRACTAFESWQLVIVPTPGPGELGLPAQSRIVLHPHLLEVEVPVSGPRPDFTRVLATHPCVFEMPARRFHLR